NLSSRVAEPLPFDHIVLSFAANAVLRTEKRRQINVRMMVKKVRGVPETVINRRRIADQPDARPANDRKSFRQQNLQPQRNFVHFRFSLKSIGVPDQEPSIRDEKPPVN